MKPNTKSAVASNALKNLKHIAGFEPGPPIEIQISRSCKISIFENSRNRKTKELKSGEFPRIIELSQFSKFHYLGTNPMVVRSMLQELKTITDKK